MKKGGSLCVEGMVFRLLVHFGEAAVAVGGRCQGHTCVSSQDGSLGTSWWWLCNPFLVLQLNHHCHCNILRSQPPAFQWVCQAQPFSMCGWCICSSFQRNGLEPSCVCSASLGLECVVQAVQNTNFVNWGDKKCWQKICLKDEHRKRNLKVILSITYDGLIQNLYIFILINLSQTH